MAVDPSRLHSRRAGCLLGQYLGDALGYPVERFPAKECVDYLHSNLKPLWFGKNAVPMYGFGQYTDDSQMARELLVNLTACHGFDLQDYASRIIILFTSHLVVDRGLACDRAVTRLAEDVPWDRAGCPPPDAGHGTAMRAAPVGMLYFDQPERTFEIARWQKWITHRDPRCDAGSIAIAGAVALAMTDYVEPEGFCGQLSEWMTAAHPEFAEMLRQLPTTLSQPPDQAVHSIRRAGLPFEQEPDWPGISPFVIPSVLWSLYCFLRSSNSYFESIWYAIACGGDVDTTAAMTGAISGAYLGLEALPNHLLTQLHNHGRWRVTDLLRLIDRMADLDPKWARAD